MKKILIKIRIKLLLLVLWYNMLQLTKYNSVFRALSSDSDTGINTSYPLLLIYRHLSKHRKQINKVSYRIIILEETLKIKKSNFSKGSLKMAVRVRKV